MLLEVALKQVKGLEPVVTNVTMVQVWVSFCWIEDFRRFLTLLMLTLFLVRLATNGIWFQLGLIGSRNINRDQILLHILWNLLLTNFDCFHLILDRIEELLE